MSHASLMLLKISMMLVIFGAHWAKKSIKFHLFLFYFFVMWLRLCTWVAFIFLLNGTGLEKTVTVFNSCQGASYPLFFSFFSYIGHLSR